MNRLLLLTLAAGLLALAAAPLHAAPAVVPKIDGQLVPIPLEGGGTYGVLISEATINAQDGADVVVSGTIGKLPENSRYWVEVGLIPKAVVDAYVAGELPSLWDEGVYVLGFRESKGVFGLAAEDYEGQSDAPSRLPVDNDGKLPFRLQLRPKLPKGKGGTAAFSADGHGPNLGKSPLAYGKADASETKPSEDYSRAYLVAQVHSAKNTRQVAVKATANLLPYGVRVRDVVALGATMTEQTSFKPGQVVIVQMNYQVFSTDGSAYKIDAQVELFGQVLALSETKTPGKYGFTRPFMVPFGTMPGTYPAKVKVALSSGGQTLYRDEAARSIKVVK